MRHVFSVRDAALGIVGTPPGGADPHPPALVGGCGSSLLPQAGFGEFDIPS